MVLSLSEVLITADRPRITRAVFVVYKFLIANSGCMYASIYIYIYIYMEREGKRKV